MEELADAIEDAQYVNAIASQDDGPKPVIPWEKASPEVMQSWEETVTREHATASRANGDPFSMEWICHQPIGFFLYSQFIKETYDDYSRINFVEEVLRYQKLQKQSTRLEKAAIMAHQFLGFQHVTQNQGKYDSALSSDDFIDSSPSVSFAWSAPPRSEITEYDLARRDKMDSCANVHSVTNISFQTTKTRRNLPEGHGDSTSESDGMTKKELDVMFTLNMDFPVCSESCIGVKGPIRKEIIDILESTNYLPDIIRHSTKVPLQPPPQESSYTRSTLSSEQNLNVDELESDECQVTPISEDITSAEPPYDKKDSPSNMSAHNTSASSFVGSRLLQRFGQTEDASGARSLASSVKHLATQNSIPFGSVTALESGTKNASLQADLFDAAELVVIESLRRMYWVSFMNSDYWIKLKNFLWYQDRRVLPEDFFVMRVLGRGGFGLVTGLFI